MRRWLPPTVLVLLLLTVSAVAFLLGTEPGLSVLASLACRSSAGRVTVGSASGTVLGAFQLNDLRYDDGIDAVAIERVALRWRPADLFAGRVHIETMKASGVRVTLGPGDDDRPTVPVDLSLPVSLQIDALAAERLTVLLEGDEVVALREGLAGPLAWHGDRVVVDDLRLATAIATLRVRGQLRTSAGYPLELVFEAGLTPEDTAGFVGSGSVRGPLAALDWELTTTVPFTAHLQGRLFDLLNTARWEASVTGDRVALAAIVPTWPDQVFTGVQIRGSGSFTDYALVVQGRMTTVGIDRPVDLSGRLQGNPDGLQVDDLRLGQDRAQVALQGRLDWAPHFAWEADIEASHLDPSLVLADWPGDFHFRLHTGGRLRDQLEATVALHELEGRLRGLALGGTGAARLDGQALWVERFMLTSGASTLRVNGSIGDRADLALQLESPDLGQLWPGAGGGVQLRGLVTGTRASPQVDLSLKGTDLVLDRNRVGTLTLGARGSLAADARFEADLQVGQLRFGDLLLATGQLRLQGSPGNHTLTVTTGGADLAAGLTLQGGWTGGQWRGRVQQARLTAPGFGGWQQERSTPLAFGPDRAEVQPLCLSGRSGQVCVQGEWTGQDQSWRLQATTVDLRLAALVGRLDGDWPLDGLVQATVDLAGQGAQLARGTLATRLTDQTLDLDLGDSGRQQVRWRNTVLRADYAAERLQAALDSDLRDGSSLHLDLALDQVRLPGDDLLTRPLRGALQVQLRDLAPLNALTAQAALFSGRLQGAATINGTVTAPEVTGTLDLEDGRAEIPQLGITLAPLHVAVRGDGGTMQVAATARSGEGDLRLEGALRLDSSGVHPGDIAVRGDGFQAVALPGLEMRVSPDLRVTVARERSLVRGTIRIPAARITSVDFESRLNASGDVVVLDDPDHAPADPGWPLEITVRLLTGEDVRIDVYGLRGRITGELELASLPDRPLTGRGTLNVNDGSFGLYGRRLQIDVGRLLFTGSTLTNPGIELQSEKRDGSATVGLAVEGFLQSPRISFHSHPYMEQSVILSRLLEKTAVGGETREETGFIGSMATKAGLGGLVPYLQDVKELTMIDEVSLETGNGHDDLSLVFGSWLTPRFYVSYGKNMLDESATFNTRYLLGKGFSIKTETGPLQSGGDIRWEFEH